LWFLRFFEFRSQPRKQVRFIQNGGFRGGLPKKGDAMKFYGYNKCSTCRKAQKFLEAKKVVFQDIDITEQPPPKTTLKKALKKYELKKLFNTSGVQYKELKIKDKIGSMTESEALDLLASNGRLVKRPIAVDGDRVTVGFNEEDYKSIWGGKGK